jgi:hypothetical protein
MPRAVLSDGQRANILKAKGRASAEVLAGEYGVTVGAIHNIWQGRTKGNGRVITDAVREMIIAGKADGMTNAELIRLSGFSDCTVKLVLRDARDEGDMRAHYDPEIRVAARKQRAAAEAARREGGTTIPDNRTALAPNSLELSLIMRGMRPEVARLNAKVWRDRHARKNEARGR